MLKPTFFSDAVSNDPSWNHIAIMVPWTRSPSEGETPNSADHNLNMLAMANPEQLPDFKNGTHKVNITYVTNENIFNWDSLFSAWEGPDFISTNDIDVLRYWASGRIGLMTVAINDRVVIRTFVDLAKVVQVDSVSTYKGRDDLNADERAPGHAWVGFVAATGKTSFSAPTILSWKLLEIPRCSGFDYREGYNFWEEAVSICEPSAVPVIPENVARICDPSTDNIYCSIIVQNAGRTAVRLAAFYSDAGVKSSLVSLPVEASPHSQEKNFRVICLYFSLH